MENKYAVEYRKIDVDRDLSVLVPKKIVCGKVLDNIYFDKGDEIVSYINNPELDGRYIVGRAYTEEELRSEYGDSFETFNDVLEFFLEVEKEKVFIIKDGEIRQVSIQEMFSNKGEKTLYQSVNGESAVFLNNKILNILENIDNIDDLKGLLRSYSDRLAVFDTEYVPKGINIISVKDGKIDELGMKTERVPKTLKNNNRFENEDKYYGDNNYSVSGLYNYLKENIIGHDEELKKIATILMLNYNSNMEYGTESILIPGPTGTGKTATFETASKYFDIPFKNINTVNLSVEGYVGTSIENEFESLIEACGGDIEKAQKAILVFDEFDKLGSDSLDLKQSLINIFLKVFEGGTFPITRQNQSTKMFNTKLASKVALGTFTEAYKKEKGSIGFGGTDKAEEEEFDRDLLPKKGYFSSELLTRFNHFIPYGELSEEDKKRILLESKLSTYLLKKKRLSKQFGVEVTGDDEFAESVLSSLKEENKSVRDMNNIVTDTFLDMEYEILDNPGKYKKLVLTRDTVKDKKYDLI